MVHFVFTLAMLFNGGTKTQQKVIRNTYCGDIGKRHDRAGYGKLKKVSLVRPCTLKMVDADERFTVHRCQEAE